MKNLTKIILILLVIIILALTARIFFSGPEDGWICQDGLWVKHGNPNESMPTEGCGDNSNKPTITYYNASGDLIRVELPFPDAVVGKEFSAIGQARGYWFFEASFPVQVIDKDGNILAIAIAQAGPDPITGEINWMTEDFVPFKADIKVPESYIGPATIIFNKDNPSGLPENEASISFPINIEY